MVAGLERRHVKMGPIERLPDAGIPANGPAGDAFLRRGISTFRHACRWVQDLPYGPNTQHLSAMSLFSDGQGTCFSKHGVIARLAQEIGLDVHKNIGFYRLNDEIVSGVYAILEPHGLSFLPQMHCFLEHGGAHVDLTEGNSHGKNKTIDTYDFVVRVAPEPALEELRRLFADHLERCRSFEPRLAAVPDETVSALLAECGRLQMSRRRTTSSAIPRAIQV
jgi:hypothetical protein